MHSRAESGRPVEVLVDNEWTQVEQLMKRIGYGEIHNLRIRNGRPAPGSKVEYVIDRLLKPGKKVNSHQMNQKVHNNGRCVELRRICKRNPEMTIERIDIQDGLPHRIRYKDSVEL